MANWKKVVVSGSSAELSQLTLDTSLHSASGGTGLSKTALASATSGQVLAIKSDLSGFELADSTSGDVQAIITPANSGLSISDTSGTDGNVAITMSISSLAAETTLAAADTFAFNDASSTDAVTAKKVTLNNLSGSIISGIAGDVTVDAGGVSSITNTATGSILDTIAGDVDVDAAGVSVIQDNKITDAMLQRATTGSILATITGDVSVDAGGVSTIGSNKVTSGMLATSLGALATNEFTGSFKGDGSDLTNVPAGSVSDALTGSILATIEGDVNVSAGGVSVIQDNKITDAMLQRATTGSILDTIAGDVDVDAGGVSTIQADSVDGSKLTDNITIAGDLAVSGDLSVAGTASFTHSTNLAVADKYILLNSGSKGGDDSGGIVIQGPNNGVGQLFGFESGSDQRWGLDSNFNADTAGGFSPEAFMSAVLKPASANDQAAIKALGGGVDDKGYNKDGNIYVSTADSSIWIYS